MSRRKLRSVTAAYKISLFFFFTSPRRLNPPSPQLSHPHLLHLLVTPLCAVLSSPLHRRASMLDFYFDHSEERPLEAFEDIFASYESKK